MVSLLLSRLNTALSQPRFGTLNARANAQNPNILLYIGLGQFMANFSGKSVTFCVYTPWVKKDCHPNHGYNFVSSWSICKLLSLQQRAVNFQQNPY